MEFQLLGPVRICCGDAVHNAGVRKRRFVLAVLALEANRLVPVDRLIDLLWPEDPPAGARGIIHGHISGLRTTLTALPGSCTASGNRHGANRWHNHRANPHTRAVCTSNTPPADETNDSPPATTDNHGRNRLCFTYLEVLTK